MNEQRSRRIRSLRCAASLLAVALSAAAQTPAPNPPAAAADVKVERTIALVNNGFESDQTEATGWYVGQHAGKLSYLFEIDDKVKHRGGQSMRITNVGGEPFGSVGQAVSDKNLGGKTVRFSAWLKTKDADTDGGASLFILAEYNGIVAHDFMAGRELHGSRDWERYTITLAIPARVERIKVGATLQGKGIVWVDDAELEVLAAR